MKGIRAMSYFYFLLSIIINFSQLNYGNNQSIEMDSQGTDVSTDTTDIAKQGKIFPYFLLSEFQAHLNGPPTEETSTGN